MFCDYRLATTNRYQLTNFIDCISDHQFHRLVTLGNIVQQKHDCYMMSHDILTYPGMKAVYFACKKIFSHVKQKLRDSKDSAESDMADQ